tara:strand:+ start:284 stop:691 length:408 start_codon:yes stop_codon:yes gene_type:complete
MKDNIKPEIWGPHGWKFLHYVSLGYPDNPNQNDKIHYKTFYESLQFVLPCKKCADNFSHNLNKFPIDSHLENKDSLIRWLIDIHNKVNKELNKKEITYENAIKLYKYPENDNLNYIFKFSILIVLLIFIYKVIKK